MPAIVSVVAVFVRSMSPLVVLVPVKLPTVLAPLNVCPVVELVVNRPVVPSVPLEFSVMAPLAVASMAPEELATGGVQVQIAASGIECDDARTARGDGGADGLVAAGEHGDVAVGGGGHGAGGGQSTRVGHGHLPPPV